ncbi:AfsR/SARP family transcriptional regulator [Paractinoplanes lichenicola]|uniref:OmpR/PhoB-type domain-containing protein n=1 Tax=Paractinoplanes lichenicola TaxID=2802976 RepID=A0ABS1VN88_9ACTN|nr:BTAD domain-containing putative transcriptional regulator [Actinoplanes lichenicola]MBL7255936.1 hypothetical protein [Actinoplanes lichenicola]
MSTVVRIRVFGGLRLWRAGEEVDVGPLRRRIVLAALLAGRGAVVTTGELVDALWGDDPSPSAVNQVQRLIGQVRRLFEPELRNRETGSWVVPVGDGYRLRVEGRALDLAAFFELAAAGRAAAARDDHREAAQKYEQALEVARQPPFAGLPPALLELPAFVAIDAARAETAVEAADIALAHPRARRLLTLVAGYAAAAPLHEPLQARLIRLLTAAGRRAEALVLFEQVRQRLAGDLGTDPTVELRAAHLDALTDPQTEPEAIRPAQLPLPVAGFTPRDDLVAALEPGRGAAVVTLSGMAGAGKTTLAVHWAHRLTAEYPDGQLYLNLRGFDPDGRLVGPSEALNTLLESVGIAAAAGSTLETRAARWRSALAGRRMILVLDNARDSAQVRPLLPGSTACLVVVTSRNRLTGLVAREAAHPVQVGRLDRAAGWDLLARRLGRPRLNADPAATDELVQWCAGLPLALSLAAARTAVRQELSLADVVAEMRAAGRRLDALGTGEPHDDVRSAFSWSYAALTPAAARLFRLLAVHPATEIAAGAVASIAGAGAGEALAELHTANIVTQLGVDRYILHDLMHAYAAELLDAGEREQAEHRLVDHYVHTSRNAYLTFGLPPPTDPGPPPAGVHPVSPPGDNAALAWYKAERPALVGAVELALDRGWARAAALIVLHVRPLRSSSAEPRSDSREQTVRVWQAVEQLGDPVLRIGLGREVATLVRATEPERAVDLLTRALDLAVREGLVFWQAQAHRSLGGWPSILDRAGRLEHLRRAVALARDAHDVSALVYALEASAVEHLAGNDAAKAVAALSEGLELARAAAMNDFVVSLAGRQAEALLQLGDAAAAIRAADWALANAAAGDIHTAYAASRFVAIAYARLGDAIRAREAARVFRELCERHADSYNGIFGADLVAHERQEVEDAVAAMGSAPALQ